MRGCRALWLVGTAMAVLVAAGCGSPPENLVLITMDTTRADHIGCYGHDALTPVIDAIAGEGTVFERAFTSAPVTASAHSSILTGAYPPFHQVRDNGASVLPDGMVTLAELFSDRGYETIGIVSAYPVRGIFGFGQGFDSFSDNFDATPDHAIVTNLPASGMARRPGDAVAREFVAWLREHGDRPFFAWLHFFDPHMPYEAPAEFADLFPARPYDAEIASMDHCIGQVRREIERLGVAERTGWVLVGDHGEGLGEHGEDTHALLAYNSTLHVPLITSFPQVNYVRPRVGVPVSVVDILPTVAEIYGLEPEAMGASSHGLSLLPVIAGEGDQSPFDSRELYFENLLPFFHFRWVRMSGLIQGEYKLIRGAGTQLYDLKTDFGEIRPLDDPEQSERLLGVLSRLEARLGEGRPEETRAELDTNSIRQLKALGYVGAGADAATDPDEGENADLIKPDVGLSLWYDFDRAARAARAGDPVAARTQLRELLVQQPVHKDARLLLAHLSAVLGDIEEARGLYEGLLVERAEIDVLHQAAAFYFGPGDDLGRARGCLERLLVRSPKDVDALTRMGRVELAQGRVDAAEAVLQQALAVDPGTRDALLLLARISDEIAEDPNQAEHLLRKALKAHPFDPVSHFNLAVHLSRTDQWPEAVRHLERASSFAPGGVFPEAHLALARLHSGRGEEAQARSRLEELLLAVDDAVMIDTARSELASLSDQDSAKNQTNLKEPEKKEGRR